MEKLSMERIIDIRLDGDYMQEDIARLLGIQRSQYSRYETEARSMPIELVDRLAIFYGVSVDYLLLRTDKKEPYSNSKTRNVKLERTQLLELYNSGRKINKPKRLDLSRLRKVRLERGVNQERIAKYLGLGQTNYSRYEIESRVIPLELLDALATYYDVSMDYLMGRTDSKKIYPYSLIRSNEFNKKNM